MTEDRIRRDHGTSPTAAEDWVIRWTRGKGCAEVAELLSSGHADHIEGNLKAACIADKVDVLVQAKASSFDLVSTAVPHAIDQSEPISEVVGAVGGGPHSPLVAAVTARIALTLGVESNLISAARDDAEHSVAESTLETLGKHAPDAARRVVRTAAAADLLKPLGGNALLVLGAPGGSWWQRQFFGPGRKLMLAAPAGAIVVRAAPRRCFHVMDEVEVMGAQMRAADALAVLRFPAAPVVADGVLIGIVRREALDAAPADTAIEALMEDPVHLAADDPLEAVAEVATYMEGAPVPVVDDRGRPVGAVSP